jgi:hypothetical protein
MSPINSSSTLIRSAICVLLLALTASVNAASLRTYTFLPNQDRLFQFRGGLLGFDFWSQLAGSFDVNVADDGSSQLTRFDVQFADVSDQGSFKIGWHDGDSLSEKLFVDPVGIGGAARGNQLLLRNPIPVQSPPVLQLDFAVTSIELIDMGGGAARVSIVSSPKYWLDNPAFTTAQPGLLTTITPEPSTLALSLISFILVAISPISLRRRAPA